MYVEEREYHLDIYVQVINDKTTLIDEFWFKMSPRFSPHDYLYLKKIKRQHMDWNEELDLPELYSKVLAEAAEIARHLYIEEYYPDGLVFEDYDISLSFWYLAGLKVLNKEDGVRINHWKDNVMSDHTYSCNYNLEEWF